MSREVLSEAALASALQHLSGWAVEDGKLHKQFKFGGFMDAMAFMNAIADVAEEMDHHPEWCNVYNRVDVNLVTHSSSGITQLDVELASQMDLRVAVMVSNA